MFATSSFRAALSRKLTPTSPHFQWPRRSRKKNRSRRKPKLRLPPVRKSSPRRKKKAKKPQLPERKVEQQEGKAHRLLRARALRAVPLRKKKSRRSRIEIRFWISIARLWKKNQFAWSLALAIPERNTRTRVTTSVS